MLLLALFVACDPPAEDAIAFCESDVAYDYDPDVTFTTFPDDWRTIADPSTGTGLRVQMDLSDPALSIFPDNYANLVTQIRTLDGFGLTPAAMLLFTAPVPDPSTLEVKMLAEEDGVFTPRDVTVTTLDHGRTLSVMPWRPLPPASRVVLAVRTDPASSSCISPSPVLRTLLTPGSATPLADRYAEGLAALGWAPEEVGAMVVYTTQSAEDVDAAVAADIATRDIALDAPVQCTDRGVYRDCRGTITVADYRAADRIVPEGDPAVQATYALPVAIWLPPADIPGPWPVLLCGHGLGGDKDDCDFIANLSAPQGIATVAVDAQQHGEHPLRTVGDSSLDQIMGLFGFVLTPPSLDAFVMRDNFRASAWDKLQVLRAVELGMDLDGDGAVDLQPDHIQYVGASLGGIMGPEVLAWDPVVAAGELFVPGGGLMNLVLDSDSFGIIAIAMTPPDWDEDDLTRTIPMVQTLIDAGDPLVHAAALSRRRAQGEQMDILLMMALGDTIVPNSSTSTLAQAFEVDGVGTERLQVPGITFSPGPITGNLIDGATGGLLQIAEVQETEGGEYAPVEHGSLHSSVQGAAVLTPFIASVFAGETPTIAEP